MWAPTLEWCRFPCQRVADILPVTTASLPEIHSAAGTERAVLKYPHVN